MPSNLKRFVLIAAILATGFCGMVAEYSVSTVVGYLTGNTAEAFSILISCFMLSMGMGSLMSKHVEANEVRWFLTVEIALSIVCTLSTVFLSRAALIDLSWEAAIFLALFIGGLIGFEIPILMRINEREGVILKENVSRVFAADYIGSFFAGLIFVPLLLPRLGTIHTPMLGGVLNLTVAIMMFWIFRPETGRVFIAAAMFIATAITGLSFGFGEQIVLTDEQSQYEDPIVYRQQTAYQVITLTQVKGEQCLYLNGQTQFCSIDEARYHELLVHPAFALNPDAVRVLVLGGGDGLAARELLKYPQVTVTMVDLDPAMTVFAQTHPTMVALNRGSLNDPRVTVYNQDAYAWLHQQEHLWDVILVDLPDPEHEALAKLYSLEFYRLVKSRLAPGGVMITQSTSPYHAPETFATIVKTVDAADLVTVPYRINVPTFGDWGFTLAVRPSDWHAHEVRRTLDGFRPTVVTKILNRDAMQAATRFEKGVIDPPQMDAVQVNRIVRPTILAAYDQSWQRTD